MNLKKLLGIAALVSIFALTACNEEKKAEAAPTGKPAAEAPAKIKVGVWRVLSTKWPKSLPESQKKNIT